MYDVEKPLRTSCCTIAAANAGFQQLQQIFSQSKREILKKHCEKAVRLTETDEELTGPKLFDIYLCQCVQNFATAYVSWCAGGGKEGLCAPGGHWQCPPSPKDRSRIC